MSRAERTSWRDDVDIFGILGAVFQLISDILGFVGSLLNAIFGFVESILNAIF